MASNQLTAGGAIAPVEIDPEFHGQGDPSLPESGFVSENGSSTTSLMSSIMRYRQENGRTYHAYKDGKYVVPNDSLEQERLDHQHVLFMMTLGNRLHLSPVGENGHVLNNVLDLGTGTGIWAIDFGDEHPEASVLGVDLSPIQSSCVPPNVRFQIDDVEEPWTFNTPFDFIHSRMMTWSISNWERYIDQAYNNLTPGGWLELIDILPMRSDDDTFKGTHAEMWITTIFEQMEKMGRPTDSALRYKQQMEARGFVNVTERRFMWPQNQWPKDPQLKEFGAWNLENIDSGLEGLSLAIFTRMLGWSQEETMALLSKVRREIHDRKIHSYWPIWVVYGQRPLVDQPRASVPVPVATPAPAPAPAATPAAAPAPTTTGEAPKEEETEEAK
ncbi:hypothetical protein TD95_002417 [Thielaviopsis punctulata]|uniref:Methyltransferase domain-containing protein n=1 Tax=Thielaviopsis punctulata TaxID=72032 RepID=A0A0F4ZDM1_9PEZI|nr:hypothetical protein TD95_002417 [Thielaviopsis punctulata]